MLDLEVYKDVAGEWRWRATHANGEVMAVSSEGYTTRAACEHSLRTVAEHMMGSYLRMVFQTALAH